MNKIINSSLFFLLLPFSLFCNTAGDSIKPADSLPPVKKMQFGVLYAPELAFRMLQSTADAKGMADIRNTLEVPKFGYSTGFNFSYQFTNKFIFEIEAIYTDKGERTKKYTLENVVSNEFQDRIPSKISFIHHYYYIDVPLKINYYLINKKIKFYITGGASINTFLYQKTTTITELKNGSDEKSNSISHPKFEKINLSVLAGFGINYDLTDNYTFRIEPTYKQSVTSIVNAPIKSYLYSFGINFGIAHLF